MKLYVKDLMGREISVGQDIVTTEPHNGRSLVRAKVVSINENGLWVRYKDEFWCGIRTIFRRIRQVVA